MSGISTGVGLISGINTSQLIQQLMAIESRPVQLLQQRVQDATAQRTAYMALSALLVAIKGAAAA
ncbi:MAG: flagellar cap protein FliD N-terminal domain-containing protein, partial [Phycisphaerae bacterium]